MSNAHPWSPSAGSLAGSPGTHRRLCLEEIAEMGQRSNTGQENRCLHWPYARILPRIRLTCRPLALCAAKLVWLTRTEKLMEVVCAYSRNGPDLSGVGAWRDLRASGEQPVWRREERRLAKEGARPWRQSMVQCARGKDRRSIEIDASNSEKGSNFKATRDASPYLSGQSMVQSARIDYSNGPE